MSQNDFKPSDIMEPQEASPMKKLSVVGIDLAQQGLHLVGMDEHGPILTHGVSLLQTKLSHREGHEAGRIGLWSSRRLRGIVNLTQKIARLCSKEKTI
jgi:hypothetical protein